ncbi:cyclic pyranopterin monophosphate synthase MoaC [Metabacillus litoralis]|uniref:cyclic pyranopterin monophosphate synthase MoaC n=1 Tax=Metabacillus litoralis TaxID=152268 RepID=UPI00203B9C06|nr:cyclic pyranopterin monophosphate synthase MoaC [Metabacillus litoralis]MCM3413488.1 cyclic pyranopterin monophosphate synthase MoaC [Metabacillus litoralis]
MSDFTHFNEQGRAKMVDISAKEETVRTAQAKTSIQVTKEVYERMINHEIGKGDVLSVAQVAGVMAAKQTSQVIPMCHPISIKGVNIEFEWDVRDTNHYTLLISVTVKTKGSTGVEMEALTSASITALTVYDMCKAVDKGMIIGPTYLVEKTGGKSGDFLRNEI